MRPIDSDKFILALMDASLSSVDEDTILDLVDSIPIVDAVPVVRCKDCMHYLIVDEFEGGKRYMCKVNRFSYINSDGDMHYCSYGERKEEPHDRLQKDL